MCILTPTDTGHFAILDGTRGVVVRPPLVFVLRILELSRKDLRIAFDEYWRLVVLFYPVD